MSGATQCPQAPCLDLDPAAAREALLASVVDPVARREVDPAAVGGFQHRRHEQRAAAERELDPNRAHQADVRTRSLGEPMSVAGASTVGADETQERRDHLI